MISENFKFLVSFIIKNKLKGLTDKDLVTVLERTYGSKLKAFSVLKNTLNGVTVDEFLSVFPIEKTYDKYGDCKDYYSSKTYVDTLKTSGEKILNEKNISEFLFEVNLNRFWFEVMVKLFMGGIDEEYNKNTGITASNMFFNYGVGKNTKTNPNHLRVCK